MIVLLKFTKKKKLNAVLNFIVFPVFGYVFKLNDPTLKRVLEWLYSVLKLLWYFDDRARFLFFFPFHFIIFWPYTVSFKQFANEHVWLSNYNHFFGSRLYTHNSCHCFCCLMIVHLKEFKIHNVLFFKHYDFFPWLCYIS